MDQSVPIHDIGPGPARTSLDPFYSMELQKVEGYWNYWRLTVPY